MLSAILLAMLISGCASLSGGSPAFRSIPPLTVPPQSGNCEVGHVPTRCTVMLQEDYQAIVLWMKASCLAHGGTKQDCQAE